MSTPRYASERIPGITVYANPLIYLAEHPRYESHTDVIGDVGGWDVADGFRLEEPDGSYSEWRISILESKVVYAVLRRFPHHQGYTFDGPLWVIIELPLSLRGSGAGLMPPRIVQGFMSQLEKQRHEPDSLITAITAIRDWLAD